MAKYNLDRVLSNVNTNTNTNTNKKKKYSLDNIDTIINQNSQPIIAPIQQSEIAPVAPTVDTSVVQPTVTIPTQQTTDTPLTENEFFKLRAQYAQSGNIKEIQDLQDRYYQEKSKYSDTEWDKLNNNTISSAIIDKDGKLYDSRELSFDQKRELLETGAKEGRAKYQDGKITDFQEYTPATTSNTNQMNQMDSKEVAWNITKKILEIKAPIIRDTVGIAENIGDSAKLGLLQFGQTAVQKGDKLANYQTNMAIKLNERVGNQEEVERLKGQLVNRADNYRNAVQGEKDKLNRTMVGNVEASSNVVTRKMAELSQSAGSNLLGVGLSLINPVLGLTYFTGSAKGSYYDEALARGMNTEQADKYSDVMAIMEGATEHYLAAENLGGLKAILEGTGFKNAMKSLGLEIGENFIQEAVMPGIGELTTKAVAGDEYLKYDFRTLEGWEQFGLDSLNDGVDGGLSAIFLNGFTKGVPSCIYLMNKSNPTQQDIKTALSDAQKAGVPVEEIMKENISTAISEASKKYMEEQQTKQQQNNIEGDTTQQKESLQKDINTLEKQLPRTSNPTEVQEIQNELAWKQKQLQALGETQVKQTEQITKNSIGETAPTDLIESAKKYHLKYQDMNLQQMQESLAKQGIKSRFDETEFTSEKEGAKWRLTRNEDGTVTREVIFNPNAKEETIVQEMEIHELAHDIFAKKTDVSDDLYKQVKEWLKRDINYRENLEALKKDYGTDNIKLVEEEAIAKTLQTKFGNQEEINNLVKYNRSAARKIYDIIIDKLNKLTHGKINWLYWEDVRNKFERAFSQEGNYKNNQNEQKLDVKTTPDNTQSKQNVNSMDNQGRTLSKQQQEYFKDSKVRDENGNLLTMYHGSPNGDFTIFKDGTYFTSRKDYAEGYQNTWASSISTKENNSNPKTYEVYLNIKNPFTIQDKRAKDIYLNEYIKGGNSLYYDPYTDYTNDINNLEEIDWTEGEDLREWLKENHPEYDGLVLDEGGTGGYGETEYKWRGKSYVTFNPEQIKNVDNTAPTSNQDIRYSISQSTENGREQLENYEKRKSKAYQKLAKEFGRSEEFWRANLDQQDLDSIKRFLSRQDEIRQKYLKDNNIKVEQVYKPIEYHALMSENETVQNFIKENDITVQKLANNEKLKAEYFNLVEEAFQEKYNITLEAAQQITQQWKELFERQKLSNNTIWALKRFESDFENIKANKTQEVDEIATYNNESKILNNSKGFKKYIDSFANLLSEEKPKLSTEELTELAQDTFGTTTDFNTGAYMTPDGKLLKFEYGGYRSDHRDINAIGYTMDEFIDAGNIRMKPEGNGFELTLEPTPEQYNTLSDYIDSLNGEVYIEIDIGKNKYDGADYKKGTPTNKIIDDLQYYFKNGKFPDKSKYADFMYSKTAQSFDEYLATRIKKKGTRTTLGSLKETEQVQEKAPAKKKTMNPVQIAQLTPEQASTTPKLKKTSLTTGDKESSFFKNVTETTKSISQEARDFLRQDENIKYYKGISNEQSLGEAYDRLQKGGASETMNWFNKKEKFNASDVAEGWILLKQYEEAGDYNSMAEVAKKMRDIGTEGGQVIQAFNILSRLTPEGMVKYAQTELSEAYNNMIKNQTKDWIDSNKNRFELTPNETQYIVETMKKVGQMEDGYDKKVELAKIQQMLNDKLPPNAGDKIKSWLRISMLFNPKTQVRNVAGNALIMPVNDVADVVATLADKAISKFTGKRTTGMTNLAAKLEGLKRGAYEATNDYRLGINTKNIDGNRFEIGKGKSFSEKNIVGRALNRTEAMLNYVMDAGDRIFSEAAFENSIQNQMKLNNTTEVTQEMIDIATQEALQRTWNDNNNYTRAVLNIRANLNNLANFKGYGLGDVLIPFAKTPANLTKAIVDYSPAGLVNTLTSGIELKRSLSNGQYDAKLQHKFVQNLGKATAGTMLYILGYALANARIISGKSDDDKDTANFLKNTLGINSYSIKIGDKSFTYDWAQPLAAPLSIMANIKNRQDKGVALLEGITGSLDTAGSILLEQSFLQSINDVLSDNKGVVSGLLNESLELPARAIPTFSKQIADMVDGTQRQTFVYDNPLKSAANNLIVKIPGASKTLAPVVDTMGREIQKYGGKNNLFNVFLNPANVSTENISTAAQEIYDVYKTTGDKTIMPRVAPYYIDSKGNRINLTPEERAEYQKTSGEIIEKSINNMTKNPKYVNAPDTEKADMLNNIINYSYNIAKKEVLGLDIADTYKKAYEYSKIGNVEDYYIFKNSVVDTNAATKRQSMLNYFTSSKLSQKQKGFLYKTYFDSDDIDTMLETKIDVENYIRYSMQDIQADKDSNGKSISGTRKNKVIEYVNSLDLSVPQKAILIKSTNTFKFNDYNNEIIDYVSGLDLTYTEKVKLLESLDMTVKSDGSVSWN